MRRPLRLLLLVALASVAALLLWPEAPAQPSTAWMAAAGVAPRFETVDGTRLRYVRTGSGSPVILLHGFAASIYTWRHVLPALARSHDTVAVDLPGFGESDQPADLSFFTYLRVLPALMDRLGIPRAAFVGHSMGGAVATLVAARESGRVTRLVLIDSAGFNLAPADRPWLVRLAASGPSALLERLPFHRLLVRQGLRQNFYDPAKVSTEEVEQYTAAAQRKGALAAIHSLLGSRADTAGSLPQEAAKVSVPTLILWGREDGWIPVADAERFEAAIKGSRKVILEACGHMPHEERPDETVPLITAFLAE